MASRDMMDLLPEVRMAAERMTEACERRGVQMLIYCTYRSFWEQARLFRKSRSWSQIKIKQGRLITRGFPMLADILMDVGPQAGVNGKHVTNAGPGESWHGYRRAFDAVPLMGGKALWSDEAEEWQVYGECAVEAGLEWAGNWKRFKEYPHCQISMDGASNPLSVVSLDLVNRIIEQGEAA